MGVAESRSSGVPDLERLNAEGGSVFCSSGKDWGVMISNGFIVFADELPNKGGYTSPGADRKDSAGEVSNLTSGDVVCLSQVAIVVFFFFRGK